MAPKVLCCIPSKGRPDNIEKYVKPLMAKLQLPYKVFIEPQDKEHYPQNDNIHVIPDNNMGLGYVSTHMKAYAEENGYELIFRVDDDVAAIGTLEEDMKAVLTVFKVPQIKAVCFPYDFEWYAITKKLFSRVNKRIQTCYIIRASSFNPRPQIKCFEDFYYFLDIITNKGKTLYCSRHGIKCPAVGSNKGGLQAFDRSELAKASIKIFKGIDPTIDVIHKPDRAWKIEPKFTHKKYRSFKIPNAKV
jgi:hypothetical protein